MHNGTPALHCKRTRRDEVDSPRVMEAGRRYSVSFMFGLEVFSYCWSRAPTLLPFLISRKLLAATVI
jgi:hypothetical protein